MTLTLYNTSSDNAALIKSLDTGTVLSVIRPTDGINLDTPVIDVQYNAKALTANYGKLTITQNTTTLYEAYYFIKSREAYPAEKVSLSCEFDPLMTYAAQILNCPANVIRTAAGTTYVKDDKYPIDPARFILHTEPLKEGVFKQAFLTPEYVAVINTAES